MCTLYNTWIRLILEYGNILYLGAAKTYLCRFDNLQSRIEQTCSVTFPPLSQRQQAAIMGLVCRLLAGEGRGNLPIYCPQLQLIADLIGSILGILPNTSTNVLLTLVTLKHWTDFNIVGWLLLQIFGMISQLTSSYRGKFQAGAQY